jgi:hypothetical protein
MVPDGIAKKQMRSTEQTVDRKGGIQMMNTEDSLYSSNIYAIKKILLEKSKKNLTT